MVDVTEKRKIKVTPPNTKVAISNLTPYAPQDGSTHRGILWDSLSEDNQKKLDEIDRGSRNIFNQIIEKWLKKHPKTKNLPLEHLLRMTDHCQSNEANGSSSADNIHDGKNGFFTSHTKPNPTQAQHNAIVAQ